MPKSKEQKRKEAQERAIEQQKPRVERLRVLSEKARNVTRVDRYDAYEHLISQMAFVYRAVLDLGTGREEMFNQLLGVLALDDGMRWSANGREFFAFALEAAYRGPRELSEFVRENFDRIELLRVPY